MFTCNEFFDEEEVPFIKVGLSLENGLEVVVLDEVVEHFQGRGLVVPLAAALVDEVLPQVRVGPVAEIVAEAGEHHAQDVLVIDQMRMPLLQLRRELEGQVGNAE